MKGSRKAISWMMLLVLVVLASVSSVIPVLNNKPEKTFMDQINDLRFENELSVIAHNDSADELAKYIGTVTKEYEPIFDKQKELGLGDDGSYFVFWEFHLKSSVAEQINLLDQESKSVFVHKDVKYWGHYIDADTLDYIVVLILDNPLYEEAINHNKN